MYTCDYGLIRARSSGRLVQEGVSSYKVHELYANYDLVFLILTHSTTGQRYSLDLADVEDEVFRLSPDITVAQWLIDLGDGSLPTRDTIPEIKTGTVRYNDAWAAKYDIQAVHPRGGEDVVYEDHELRDLRLTRIDTDYEGFFKRCLVTVSGLLHLVDYDENGILIKEGGRTSYLSRDNAIGLLSFADVGELTCFPLAETMVAARTEDEYKAGVYVKLPEPIGKRTVMLSLGGYLHLNNQHYRIVNDDTILIEWWALDIVRRYIETRSLIDQTLLTSLINRNLNHSGAIDRDAFDQDVAILAYLNLSQSFVILVDADNLYVEKHPLESTGLPGRYYAYTRPALPMLTTNGFLPAYTAVPEKIAFTLCVPNNLVHSYAAEHADQPDRYQNSALFTPDAKRYGSAYLLEIGASYI